MVHLNFHLASSSRFVSASLRLHSPRCHPKFILYKHHLFSSIPAGRHTKSPPGQRSGAESVRRAGGVKIPVFILIPSSNPLLSIPSLPSLQFPPLRSGHFRSGSSVFFFSLILLRMFVSFSRQIPFRYAPWSFSSLPHSPPSCD